MKFPSPDGESWFNAFRLDGRVPGDVVATVAFVVVADLAIFLPVVSETWVRTLLGLPLVFVLPGYALVSVLFPRRARTAGSRRPPGARKRIDWAERLALSLGGSLLLVPFVALALAGLGIGLSGPAVVLTLSAFVAVAMATGAARRWRVPPEDRLRAPVGRLREEWRARLAPTRRGRLLQLAAAASVLLATSSLAFALAVPPTASSAYTGAALLTEDDSGELVASGYPTDLRAGEPAGLVLALENHEGEETTYAVVIALERVRTAGEEVLVERRVLSRLDETVAANETAYLRHEVEPTMTGEDLRLSYYVYRGEPPDAPSADSAYRHLFLRVNVSAPA